MASKIILKKSSVAAKAPVAGDLDFGELAINYTDSKLYFKKADGSIDAFVSGAASAPVTSVGGNIGAITDAQLIASIKNVDGAGSGLDADFLDGNHASAFYLASNPNGYTSNTGTVTSVGATTPLVSSGGTTPSISIPAATASANGYMSSAYASKLDGIAAGAQVNVATNLGYTAATRVLTSSTGTSVTLPQVTTSADGLMIAADKTKLNGIATGATANTGTVTSVGGTGTVSGLTLSGTVTTSGNLTLGGTLSVTPSNFGSQPANTVLAAPNGSAGTPTFRTLVDADIPALTMAKLPGAAYKQSVVCATTANITLSGTQTIDGIAVVAGNRVLVKNQTTASQNGIYVVAAGTWTRSVDADAADEIGAAVVNVDSGTTNGGELWTTTFKTTDTLGTTAMNWYEVLYNTGTWSISVTGSSASTTGNAATATALQNPRTLWGQSFNGTANITGALSSVTTIGMSGQLTNTLATGTAPMVITSTTRVANLNVATAGTADALTTARTINNVSFNGSTNITVTANTTNTLTLGSYLTGGSFNGSAAVTAAVDATSANTASKVVARDASGNFSAGTITAALNGNAATVTNGVYLTSAQTLTNKTMDYNSNTFTNFPSTAPFSNDASLAQIQAIALSF